MQAPTPILNQQITIDPLTITLLGGMIVTVISALVTGTVAIITAIRLGTVKEQQQVAAARLDTVSKDTEAIKGHVNSEKTAADGRLNTLQKENAMLREMLADKKATADLLAQATASRVRGGDTPAAQPAVTDAAVVESLQQIDVNTAAIEKNTAHTEQSVRELKDHP